MLGLKKLYVFEFMYSVETLAETKSMASKHDASSKNAQNLPDEIIAQILKSVPGKEVYRNRRVCRRWRDAVDNLPDSFWRSQCSDQDLSDEYAKVCSKYGLSWRATYKALNSWDNIKQLPMTIHQPVFCTDINRFQVLPNGILALSKNLRHPTEKENYSDTVVYYNLETDEECSREEYDFLFRKYEENQHYKVVIKSDNIMCIKTKHDQQWHLIPLNLNEKHSEFTIIDDEVYSHTDNSIVLSKLLEVNGKLVLKTKELPEIHIDEDVFVVAKKNGILYVMGYGPSMEIKALLNNTFKTIEECGFYMFHKLHDYGFNRKINEIFEQSLVDFDSIFATLYGHGHIMISSYHNYDSKPTIEIIKTNGCFIHSDVVHTVSRRSIDVQRELALNISEIKQLDIVETETHHKILALGLNKLYIFEFQYTFGREEYLNKSSKRVTFSSDDDVQLLAKKSRFRI